MKKLILKQEVLDAYDNYVKAFIKGETSSRSTKVVWGTCLVGSLGACRV